MRNPSPNVDGRAFFPWNRDPMGKANNLVEEYIPKHGACEPGQIKQPKPKSGLLSPRVDK